MLCASCCIANAATSDSSADGRWHVGGEAGSVVIRDDAGTLVKAIPARSLASQDESNVTVVRYLPHRRSFVLGFTTLREVWELSIDPSAPDVHDGLVHDYRQGEAIGSPGFLGVRRTQLAASVQALVTDSDNNAYVLARTADAWWLVNLDIRRSVTRFTLATNPDLRPQRD